MIGGRVDDGVVRSVPAGSGERARSSSRPDPRGRGEPGHARRRHAWIVAALLPLSSCGDDPAAPAAAEPAVIRLIDHLDRADFEGSPGVPRSDADGRTIAQVRFGDPEGGDAVRLVGAEVAELLAPRLPDAVDGDPTGAAPDPPGRDEVRVESTSLCLEGAALVSWSAPIARERAIEVALRARGEFGMPPEVIELEEVVTPEELQGSDRLSAVVGWTSVLSRTALEPVGPAAATPGSGVSPGREVELAERVDPSALDGAPRTWRAVLRPRPGTRAILVWASSLRAPGPVWLEELRLRHPPPGRYLDPVERDDATDRRALRVSAAGTERESIVLDAPESMRLRLRLPSRAPRLRFFGSPLPGALDVPLTLRAVVAPTSSGPTPSGSTSAGPGPAAELEVSAVLEGHPPAWTPFELDLAPFAGQDVEVRIGAECAVLEDPLPVAVGAPVIESTAGANDVTTPDVVLISLDTFRRDRMGLYGGDRPTTPNIDRLALESVVFDAAVSPTSWTLPAHASLFSGRAPQGHRVTEPDDRVDVGRGRLIAQRLRAAGYETVAFTGGGFLNPQFGLSIGFERYSYLDPLRYRLDPGGAVELREHAPRVALLETLREARRRPRFVFVHTYAAHDYVATPEDLAAVGAPPGEVRATPLTLRMRKASGMLQAAAAEGPDGPTARAIRNLYDASMRAGDRLVGEVVDALRAAGRLDHTILVVCSDHGEELLEQGRFGHGTNLGETQIQIPLLIRAPGLAPRRVSTPVSLVDVAPTLAALCGVEPPHAASGRSLVPLLHGEPAESLPLLLGLHRIDGVRTSRWKLLEEAGERHLYDLAADPVEMVDRVGASSREVDELGKALRRMLEAARIEPAEARKGLPHAEVEAELRELGYVGK